jgi:hypothetical protein
LRDRELRDFSRISVRFEAGIATDGLESQRNRPEEEPAMTVATPRSEVSRTTASKVADAAGKMWRHDNPAELYRWVSHRNELLKTIDAAKIVMADLSRR